MSLQAVWLLRTVCIESCTVLKISFDAVFGNMSDCDRLALLTFGNSRKLRFAVCFKADPYVALLVYGSKGKSGL